jgi:ankyrin repeat protein
MSYNHPIATASRNGDVGALKTLITNKNINDTYNGKWTALLISVHRRHFECAKFLIARRADLELGLDFGDEIMSNLHYAAENGDVDMIRLLLANGAMKNNEWIKSPLRAVIDKTQQYMRSFGTISLKQAISTRNIQKHKN